MARLHLSSRRKFIRQLGSAGLLLSAGQFASRPAMEEAQERLIPYLKKTGPNDNLNIAVIGMGIMGNQDLKTALKVPGIRLVAACDLYKGRLERLKELYGNEIHTTRDYREILERSDVDAVVVATNDYWHARISMDAMNKGKAVYCEKPMVHKLDQGLEVIRVQQATKKTMQVGSQRVSSIAFAKARDLFRAGEIGQLSCIEAYTDRQDPLGAWEYTMPTDEGPQTVDWDRYIEGMPRQPYDAKKFFWWRNYRDFGTGVAGDLFVHLFSGIHLITGSMGPERIFASGQLCYWKDGRDVADVMCGIMQYPETKDLPAFQVVLRVNFISGQGEAGSTKFIGSEGVMEINNGGVRITHHKMARAHGIGGWDSLETYPKAMQENLLAAYDRKYSREDRQETILPPTVYQVPDGYDEHLDHFTHFFEGVRTGKPVVEDPVFGFRAAAPCLAANESYFQKKIIHWDPVNMKLI